MCTFKFSPVAVPGAAPVKLQIIAVLSADPVARKTLSMENATDVMYLVTESKRNRNLPLVNW